MQARSICEHVFVGSAIASLNADFQRAVEQRNVLARGWRVARRSGHAPQFSASDGIAVYVTWRSIHALNLLTGQDVVIATEKRAIDNAAFDRTGLLYDYNLTWTANAGRIVFSPFTRIAAAVGE